MIERALIVRKEHLDKIFQGLKSWEMRSTGTNVRGRIGLIEAGSGLIMGEVTLLASLHPIQTENCALMTAHFHQVTDFDLLKKWKYPWLLEDPKRYDKPIPYNHPKGAVIWVKLNNGEKQ